MGWGGLRSRRLLQRTEMQPDWELLLQLARIHCSSHPYKAVTVPVLWGGSYDSERCSEGTGRVPCHSHGAGLGQDQQEEEPGDLAGLSAKVLWHTLEGPSDPQGENPKDWTTLEAE